MLVIPENSLIHYGEAFDLDGTVEDYLWEQIEGEPLNFQYEDTVLTVTDIPEGEYAFRFTVIDNDTLSSSDEFEIRVADFGSAIQPPKFFSPNADGIGDIWEIENIEVYASCSLKVFSRAGTLVYQAQPYLNNWDGTYRGSPVADGDYYYVFQCNGQNVKTGGLRIIR